MSNIRVAVAMSGGVDSSLTTLLLKEQGYDVFGITMLLSDDRRDNAMEGDIPKYIADAQKVAEGLGIEHHVLDLRDKFKECIVDCFVNEYAQGRTPNPCVICNRQIKFAEIWNLAKSLGADYMATGHYARVMKDENSQRYVVKKGVDNHKDQSYALYRLPQEILSHVLLPLGEICKTATRALAEKYGLIVADKPESQEICFVPDDDYKALIRKLSPEVLKKGDIVDIKGKVLGRHDGIALYTIGQRKGMGIAAPEPLYVVKLDSQKNQVVVGGAKDVFSNGLIADQVNWVALDDVKEPFTATVKVRYGNRENQATITPLENGTVQVDFMEPVRAVTPGQSAVFYNEDTVLGGGIILHSI